MNKKTLIKLLTMVLATALVLSVQVFAAEITIIGTINDIHQIVTEAGEIYELADNDLAVELSGYVGQTVEVTGTLIEEDDVKTILVREYEIIEKA
jgi:hypothetical protein